MQLAGQPLFGSLGDSAPDTWGRAVGCNVSERRNARSHEEAVMQGTEHDEGTCRWIYLVAGRLRGRPRTKPGSSPRARRRSAAPMAGRHENLPCDDGRGRRHVGDRRDVCRAIHARHGRLDPRPQYVRSCSRPVAGRQLEGLVGRYTALSLPCLRPDTVCAGTRRHGRRHGLPLRDRWHRRSAGTSQEAAGGADIRIGGGASTIRQYLQAGAIDELHLAISPMLLGGGEALFAGIDLPALGYAVVEHAQGENAMHVVLARQAPPK